MNRLFLSSCFLLALSLPGSPAFAEIHKWIDADGNVQFGDRPPSDRNTETIAAPKSPSAPPAGQSSAAIMAKQRLKDSEAEQAKQKASAAELANQKKAQQAECVQIKRQLATFERGGRIVETQDNGEPHYFSAEEIDASRIKYQKMLKERCS